MMTNGAACMCLDSSCTPDPSDTDLDVLTFEFALPSGFALQGLMQPFSGHRISFCTK